MPFVGTSHAALGQDRNLKLAGFHRKLKEPSQGTGGLSRTPICEDRSPPQDSCGFWPLFWPEGSHSLRKPDSARYVVKGTR